MRNSKRNSTHERKNSKSTNSCKISLKNENDEE